MARADDSIRELASEVAEQTADARQRLSDKLTETVGNVGDSISDAAGKLRDSAQSAAETSKDYAADALHGLASTTRDMAGKLDSRTADGDSRTAGYARLAAEQMDDMSARLRDLEVAQAARRARSVVRDNPVLVVGAAVVVGFALARLLKGSGDD